MSPLYTRPTLLQTIRHTLGRALRETGQMLDRVGIRGSTAALGESRTVAAVHSGHRSLKANEWNWAAPVDVETFDIPLSRHRTVMPLFAAGAPSLPDTTGYQAPFIAPCAAVIGNVTIEENVSVWYGAVIRGDSHIKKLPDLLMEVDTIGVTIGEGTNVQDNAVISSDPYTGRGTQIGKRVTVGHSASIIGANVGDNVLVGMGAILSSGSVVESGSFIAAGAHVQAGQVVKSGELWGGQPARKLKELTAKQKMQLVYQADEYVKLSKRHKHVMVLNGREVDEEVHLEVERAIEEEKQLELDQEPVAALGSGFKAADMDGDGTLDKDEALVLLQGMKILLGGDATREMVDEMFLQFDVDENGKLDREEFQKYVENKRR